GVADELLDRSAPLLELVAQQGVVRIELRLHVFDVHLLGETREPDQVGEKHRHDLAFLPALHVGEPRAAAAAEARLVGVFVLTPWARDHGATLIGLLTSSRLSLTVPGPAIQGGWGRCRKRLGLSGTSPRSRLRPRTAWSPILESGCSTWRQ